MKSLLVLCSALALALGGSGAQTSAWPPSPAHPEMPLWPETPPDAQPATGPERLQMLGKSFFVAGRPTLDVSNVSRPTMTLYSPTANNTNVAVVVFPGGGYQSLSIDLEGTEVCDWLTTIGITCVLLKYRVPNSGMHFDRKCNCQVRPKAPTALEDAQRTVGLVRHHAAEWHIDPRKIGVLGFSAGGHLVADISTHFERRLYPPVDNADRVSCRPDFAVALYPGHLWIDEKKFELNPDIRVTKETPPTFLAQAENDPVDSVNNSLVYFVALKKAGVPVEMHLYAQGGHAFGLRHTKFPITSWPQLVVAWLGTLGFITA
jgi:acetyl esterase/lipase